MSVWTCGGCGTKYSVGAPRCPHCSANQPADAGAGPAALASLTVACANSACEQQGVTRRVLLPQVAPGVVDVPNLQCAGCRCALPEVEEEDMPKITVHGGVSNADTDDTAAPAPEGSEDTSPGNSSSTSSETPSTSPETSENAPSKPARKTANRSSQGRTGISTARSTDGAQTAPTSASDKDSSGASDTA